MVVSYPVPPYSNVPIQSQWYKPNVFIISAISLGQTTTVTTTVNNNYVIGQEVRLIIPLLCGSRQLNGISGYVIAIPSPNQVTINIFSIGSDAFKSVATGTQPQILAIGDINSGYINTNAPNTVIPSIPGAFINISPN